MKASFIALAISAICAASLNAQMGRTSDWWTYAGDAQRTGWEKSDQKFVKEDVKDFKLLWSMKLKTAEKGPRALSSTIVLGNLIGSRGFKELAFVQSAGGDLWSIDSDLARPYWDKHFPATASDKKTSCGNFATVPNLPAPVVFRLGARPATPAATPPPAAATPPPATPSPAPPPTAPSGAPSGQGIPGGGPGAPATGPAAGAPPAQAPAPSLPAAFRVRPIYIVMPDGQLGRLNVDDGSNLQPPSSYLPAGAHAYSMNMADDVVYTIAHGCNGTPDSVVGMDVSSPQAKPVSFASKVPLQAMGGPAIGTDGTVYVQSGSGESDAAGEVQANSLIALSAKELKVKDYVTLPSSSSPQENGMNITTPVLFNYKGRELVVTAGKDGQLYLLDAKSLGGSDHKTPLSHTEALVKPDAKNADKGIWGNLASWEATDGTRYVLATVWGPLSDGFKAPVNNGNASNGSIVAFKVTEQNGQPALEAAWTSPDLVSPDAPVIAQGVVFALSNGKYKRKVKKSRGAMTVDASPAKSAHAVLYALDGATGKEIWSTGDKVTSAGNLSGLTIANSRVYFTTVDNTLQVFGKFLETE